MEGGSQVVLVVKNTPVSAGGPRDMGSISGSGRSPGIGNSNPLQYPCLENSMDRRVWPQRVRHDWAYINGRYHSTKNTQERWTPCRNPSWQCIVHNHCSINWPDRSKTSPISNPLSLHLSLPPECSLKWRFLSLFIQVIQLNVQPHFSERYIFIIQFPHHSPHHQ